MTSSSSSSTAPTAAATSEKSSSSAITGTAGFLTGADGGSTTAWLADADIGGGRVAGSARRMMCAVRRVGSAGVCPPTGADGAASAAALGALSISMSA